MAIVLVVDLQTGMFDGLAEPPVHDAAGLVGRVRAILDWARSAGHGLAFVRHDGPPGDPLAPGASGWDIWPELGRRDDEPIFGKKVGDAFSNPDLSDWIGAHGDTNVILLGAQSDFCVQATMMGALGAGLDVTVVSDAHSTWDTPDAAAPDIIARCNDTFARAGARLVATDTLIAPTPDRSAIA